MPFIIFKRFSKKKNNLWALHPRCNHSKPNNCIFFYSSVPFCIADEGNRKKSIQVKSQAPLITAIEIYPGIKVSRHRVKFIFQNIYNKVHFWFQNLLLGPLFCGGADARVKRFSILSLFWKFFYLMYYLVLVLLVSRSSACFGGRGWRGGLLVRGRVFLAII